MPSYRKLLISSLALASLFAARSTRAQLKPDGTSCDGDCIGELPACQNAWQPYISTVFLGRVTNLRTEWVPIIGQGRKSHTEKLRVTFAASETFIGPSEKIVTLTSGGDMCAFPFAKGYEYLVYAKRLLTGELYVSTCYGSKLVTDASEDLKYLRNLPNIPPGATVFGTARRFTRPGPWGAVRPIVPETGHKVIIKGATQNYETTVDAHGKFKIAGLPPGHYTVSLDSAGEVSIFPAVKSTTVDIANKGCARFNFLVDPFTNQQKGESGALAPGGAGSADSCLFDPERGEVAHCLRHDSNGELFVTPQVLKDLVFDLHGLAVMHSRLEGWMYVNRKGKVLLTGVPTDDNWADAFSGGLVRVVKKTKYGFANRSGQIVVQPVYDGAFPFHHGEATVCKGCKVKCVSGCEYHTFTGGDWFRIDNKGTILGRIHVP